MIAYNLNQRIFFYVEDNTISDSPSIKIWNHEDIQQILQEINIPIEEHYDFKKDGDKYELRVGHIPSSSIVEARGISVVDVLNNLLQHLKKIK